MDGNSEWSYDGNATLTITSGDAGEGFNDNVQFTMQCTDENGTHNIDSIVVTCEALTTTTQDDLYLEAPYTCLYPDESMDVELKGPWWFTSTYVSSDTFEWNVYNCSGCTKTIADDNWSLEIEAGDYARCYDDHLGPNYKSCNGRACIRVDLEDVTGSDVKKERFRFVTAGNHLEGAEEEEDEGAYAYAKCETGSSYSGWGESACSGVDYGIPVAVRYVTKLYDCENNVIQSNSYYGCYTSFSTCWDFGGSTNCCENFCNNYYNVGTIECNETIWYEYMISNDFPFWGSQCCPCGFYNLR